MILTYTVCSANYLGQAKALYFSMLTKNPKTNLVLGLVDELSENEKIAFNLPFEVIELSKIPKSDIVELSQKYTMHELTCACKPIVGNYLISRNKEITELRYFDTDMLVFNDLGIISDELSDHSILITPHFWTPIIDKKHQQERDFLNSGLYNAGFFALNIDDNSKKMMQWWEQKTRNEGYLRYDLGLGSDQLWFNFIPLFFEKVKISRNLGLNVGYWNLHEREVSFSENLFKINQITPLYFYHYSGFSLQTPNIISKHQDRFNFENYSALKLLFEIYQTSILENQPKNYQNRFSVYDHKKLNSTSFSSLKNLVKRRISYILWKLIALVEPNPKFN